MIFFIVQFSSVPFPLFEKCFMLLNLRSIKRIYLQLTHIIKLI